MKDYRVKTEFADQNFGGECDTAYVKDCMQNGMPEEDVMHLVREFGEDVLNQFDIEEDADDGIYETEKDAIEAMTGDMAVVPVSTWKYDSGVGYRLVDWSAYWYEVNEAAGFLFEDRPGYEGEDPDDLIETYHYNRRFAEDVCKKIDEILEEKKPHTWKVCACGGEHDGELVAEFESEALAINYCYDHTNDYPLGHSILDPDGNDVENW